jgi:hypothetical protein
VGRPATTGCDSSGAVLPVNTLCGVRAVWWSLVNENTGFDWGILRTGDLSRKPIDYTIQALTRLLSGARPDAGIVATVAEPAPELRCEPMRGREGEILVALWSAVPPQDDAVARPVTLSGYALRRACGSRLRGGGYPGAPRCSDSTPNGMALTW